MTEKPGDLPRRTGRAVASSAALPGALLLTGIVLFIDAQEITGLAVVGMGPAVFPMWISALLVASAALTLVTEVYRSLRADERVSSGAAVQSTAEGPADSRNRWGPPAMSLLFVLYVAGMTAVGFYTATFLFAGAAMSLVALINRTGHRLRDLVVHTIPIALLITLAIYGTVTAIGMRSPDGGPLL